MASGADATSYIHGRSTKAGALATRARPWKEIHESGIVILSETMSHIQCCRGDEMSADQYHQYIYPKILRLHYHNHERV